MKVDNNILRHLIVKILFFILFACIGGYVAYTYVSNTHKVIPLPFQKNPTLCKDCNVILVSLDTVSANHLPCYGYERDTAPNLCAFGKENILFQNTFANASWTLPSHVSIFTGLYPFTHGVNTHQDILPSTTQFLPAILKDAGYTTIFVYPPGMTFSSDKIYNRGIDKYYDEDKDSSWSPQLEEFRDNVENNKKTFLFLHTYAAHPPFLIGDEPMLYKTKSIKEIPITDDALHEITDRTVQYIHKNISEFINSRDFSEEETVALYAYKNFIDQNTDLDAIQNYSKALLKKYANLNYQLSARANYDSLIDTNNPEHIAYIKALYDQKIHQLDNNNVKGLIQFYTSNPDVQRNTILIFTADHGEEFMEHGKISHITSYDTNLRVPLVMAVPNVSKRTITEPVQSVDITPTILDIIGVPLTSPVQGISLVGGILGRTISNRILVEDEFFMTTKTIRWQQWKLFVHVKDKTLVPYELYDYKKDPKETKNVLSSHFAIAKQILQRYEEYAKKWNK